MREFCLFENFEWCLSYLISMSVDHLFLKFAQKSLGEIVQKGEPRPQRFWFCRFEGQYGDGNLHFERILCESNVGGLRKTLPETTAWLDGGQN